MGPHIPLRMPGTARSNSISTCRRSITPSLYIHHCLHHRPSSTREFREPGLRADKSELTFTSALSHANQYHLALLWKVATGRRHNNNHAVYRSHLNT